jgi:DNA-binding NarL/FixJ family response regulator
MDRGPDTGEISQVLGISAVTVRRHVSHVVQKLRAPDRRAALRLIRERVRAFTD